jgi:tripartite ATP-independent transporter DctP family solute receptor
MRKVTRSEVLRGLLGVTAALSLPTKAFADTFVFSIGHVLDPQHPVQVGALQFKKVAEEKSNGRIKVNVFPAGMLGNSRELALQCKIGTIFGVIDATTKFVDFVTDFALLDIPFLANDARAAFAIMDSATATKVIYEKSIKAGFRPIHGWDVAFRDIYTSRRPITAMNDLKGLKIRTIPSPTYINLFRAFGAAATPMDFGELYTALQQGVVDGAENDLLTYESSKHYEVAPLMATTRHMMLVNTLFVSQKVWKSLPSDIRDIVASASLEARKAATQNRRGRDATITGQLKAHGVKFTEPDLKPFVAASEQTLPWFVQKCGAPAVDAIRNVAKKTKS